MKVGVRIMDELPAQHIKDLIQQDDPAALDIIYDILGQRLYHYVLGLLGSEPEAQDVIQELFIRHGTQSVPGCLGKPAATNREY